MNGEPPIYRTARRIHRSHEQGALRKVIYQPDMLCWLCTTRHVNTYSTQCLGQHALVDMQSIRLTIPNYIEAIRVHSSSRAQDNDSAVNNQ